MDLPSVRTIMATTFPAQINSFVRTTLGGRASSLKRHKAGKTLDHQEGTQGWGGASIGVTKISLMRMEFINANTANILEACCLEPDVCKELQEYIQASSISKGPKGDPPTVLHRDLWTI